MRLPEHVASPVAVSVRPQAGRRWLATPWSLWLALVLVVSIDALMGISGALSYVTNTALTLLFVPWTVLVFRKETAVRGPALGDRHGLLLHTGLTVVALGFLIAKWLVLQQAPTNDDGFVRSARNYGCGLLMVMSLGLMGRGLRASRLVALAAERPTRLLATSFGLVGALGSFLLSLPMSLNSLSQVSLIDNLFMSFSAVCVTGLAVRNVAETYSLFGQGVLCALIQVGGLGIMVLSAAVAMLAGQRLRVSRTAALTQLVDGTSLATLRRTVLMICVYTLVLEATGAILLYPQLSAHPELTGAAGPLSGPNSPAWASIFHAVSAFCNAGFSNLRGGLLPFSGSLGVLTVITSLILLGGIGFPVLDDLARKVVRRVQGKRTPLLSLNTRVALGTSAILLTGMAFAYLVLEWRSSFASLSVIDRLTAALFQSASSRTAGFNVVDVGAMLPSTLVLTCAAMFIGASPGSTGGGIKTTTAAALYAGLRAELSGNPPHLHGRKLPEPVIRKAIGVSVLSMLIVLFAFFLMLLFEPHPPLALAFEVVSAFSTTGLSTGITPELSVPGRLLITLVMFVGRIGPLTLALALARISKPSVVALPEERVMIG